MNCPICTTTAGLHTSNAGYQQKHDLGCFESNVPGEDENDRALKELDTSLLKPHPEWRNSAAGPIFRDNFHEILWGEWKKTHNPEHHKQEFDEAWEDYSDRFGCAPTDYFQQSDYDKRYLGKLVWKDYVRNKKGAIQKQKTRWHCFKDGKMNTGSPCPLCRDDRLLLSYKNIPLLKQFIDTETGAVHHPLRTGVCRFKQKRLEKCISLAQSLGYLPKVNYFYKFDDSELSTKYSHAL